MPDLASLGHFWVYLSASPLAGLTLTLCAYVLAQAVYAPCRYSPLANPVAIAMEGTLRLPFGAAAIACPRLSSFNSS